ncbi:FGGY family carbohydrate kinase [Flavobacteriaceae bacterium]|jgi:xylulokinase|nr:FGGY family carbohydrate kinase [Flavobacteriaceae bacterium]MDA9865815.1 FGGY family carbohydrate kinase [Flavobacteriaceae bacterium]
MYNLGLDLGTSFIKAALTECSSGNVVNVVSQPSSEQKIKVFKDGWAEQDPEIWWKNTCLAIKNLISLTNINPSLISRIGISYQMHGLVLLDDNGNLIRDSIIWCDDRAVSVGKKAFIELGKEKCIDQLLNSPANFTASKLKWVKNNEKELYNRVYKFMLPGDYIAYRFSGKMTTTNMGLSEAIFWDFKKNKIADFLLKHYEIDNSLIPEIVSNFGFQCKLNKKGSSECGLVENIPIYYRAGDQPNNALSLNVLKPGEVAATAGTSGVLFAVTDNKKTNENERINNFLHVEVDNSTSIGKLLCINGAGIQYAKLKNKLNIESYEEMNKLSLKVGVGSEELTYLPFGNGSERMLNNINVGSSMFNFDKRVHNNAHLIRATLEGIAFAFVYGMQILIKDGVKPSVVRAGNDNLFKSNVFGNTVSTLINTEIEIYDTTGAVGAARAVDLNNRNFNEFGKNIIENDFLKTFSPQSNLSDYKVAYDLWVEKLKLTLNKNI